MRFLITKPSSYKDSSDTIQHIAAGSGGVKGCSCLPRGYLSESEYSGDCFDKVVVHFNSRICVCECSVRVICL